jgi:hypothetical protein
MSKGYFLEAQPKEKSEGSYGGSGPKLNEQGLFPGSTTKKLV